jgi:release factor glutamine methyltransferase
MSQAAAQTPLAVTAKAASWLAARGVQNARLEAELLLAAVLGLKRLDLYLQYDRPLTAAELDGYRALVRRRGRREPLQYVIGSVAFRELELRVDGRALIPRPETESLVGAVLEWAGPASESRGRPLRAVDIGTGSGAIALSLLREGPFERVIATDVSAAALALASENAAAAGLRAQLDLRPGALFEPIAGVAIDVVVSNPPYVAEGDRETLAPEVRDWEPAGALYAADAGYAVLAALVDGAAAHLSAGGLLALEVGLGQAGSVAARAEATGRYAGVRVVRDLADRERIVLAERR